MWEEAGFDTKTITPIWSCREDFSGRDVGTIIEAVVAVEEDQLRDLLRTGAIDPDAAMGPAWLALPDEFRAEGSMVDGRPAVQQVKDVHISGQREWGRYVAWDLESQGMSVLVYVRLAEVNGHPA